MNREWRQDEWKPWVYYVDTQPLSGRLGGVVFGSLLFGPPGRKGRKVEITLPRDTRYFTLHGDKLSRTGETVPKGTRLHISLILKAVLDQQAQEVVMFRYRRGTHYFLVHEIGIPGLLATLRQRATFSVVK